MNKIVNTITNWLENNEGCILILSTTAIEIRDKFVQAGFIQHTSHPLKLSLNGGNAKTVEFGHPERDFLNWDMYNNPWSCHVLSAIFYIQEGREMHWNQVMSCIHRLRGKQKMEHPVYWCRADDGVVKSIAGIDFKNS